MDEIEIIQNLWFYVVPGGVKFNKQNGYNVKWIQNDSQCKVLGSLLNDKRENV